jgi:hypothetical protein
MRTACPRRCCIDHGQPQHHADLRRGEADTGHRLHRVDHVVPDRADLVGDLSHRSAAVRSRLSGQDMKGLTGILGLQRAARLGGNPVEGHDPVEVVDTRAARRWRRPRRGAVHHALRASSAGRSTARAAPRPSHRGSTGSLRPRPLGGTVDDLGVHADEGLGRAVLPRDIHDEQPDRVPTCGAARPRPGAAYIVSSMSAARPATVCGSATGAHRARQDRVRPAPDRQKAHAPSRSLARSFFSLTILRVINCRFSASGSR